MGLKINLMQLLIRQIGTSSGPFPLSPKLTTFVGQQLTTASSQVITSKEEEWKVPQGVPCATQKKRQ